MTVARKGTTHGMLRLVGEVTIYRVTSLKGELQQALHASPRLDLDMTEVCELDTAGAQLLLWATRQAARAGGELRLLGLGPTVRDALDALGLTRHLELRPMTSADARASDDRS